MGGCLQPQLAGNGVTSHALNYCTFVAGRPSAANCLSVDQTANISTAASATSPPLIPARCLLAHFHPRWIFLSPPHLSHAHRKHDSLSLFSNHLHSLERVFFFSFFFLFIQCHFSLLAHAVYTDTDTHSHSGVRLTQTRRFVSVFTQFTRQLIFTALLTEACLLSGKGFKKKKKQSGD